MHPRCIPEPYFECEGGVPPNLTNRRNQPARCYIILGGRGSENGQVLKNYDALKCSTKEGDFTVEDEYRRFWPEDVNNGLRQNKDSNERKKGVRHDR